MKIKRLIIHNIGKISDAAIDFNKPLILFYGEILQGKTTILNAVKWCFGGAYPEDIINHGKEKASVVLEFEGGSISREWYKAKDGSTKDRPINFIRDGKPFKGRVVDEIKKFLNPYLLDQDHLRKMTELERKAYFVQLFGVDTTEIDQQYAKAESEAKDLRAKIKGYGVIDTTEVKSIDVMSLKEELGRIRKDHSIKITKINSENSEINIHNLDVRSKEAELSSIQKAIIEAEERLVRLRTKVDELEAWIIKSPKRETKPLSEPPDTSILETQISEAAANEVRVEQYKKNLRRAEERDQDEAELSILEHTQREIKKEKATKLAKIGENCGIKNLSFDEEGNFIYEGTTAGMLSGSQIMKLSSELSGLYPTDLGIELLDRAESLGRTIFDYVEYAERRKSTVLATIVGEKPAVVPDRIGVFVVKDGMLISD